MKSLRGVYYFSIIVNVITLITIIFFIISLSGLNFKRTRILSDSTFALQTNDYVTAKYIFIYIIPVIVLIMTCLISFIRVIALSVFDSTNVLDKVDKKSLSNQDEIMSFVDTISSLRISHIIISIIALISFIISFIFLCIEYGNCNKIGPLGSKSICSDQLYCCSTDVITPPGIVEGCPWIQSCSGLTPSVSTLDLKPDPYFLWNFIINIVVILLLITQLFFGFYREYEKPQQIPTRINPETKQT
jgi:hypothetical protein